MTSLPDEHERIEASKQFLRTAPDDHQLAAFRDFARQLILKAGLGEPSNIDSDEASLPQSENGAEYLMLFTREGDKTSLIYIKNDSGVPRDKLYEIINQFLFARSWLDAYLILEQHPELRSAAVDVILRTTAQNQEAQTGGKAERASATDSVPRINADLLRRCREIGDIPAFAEVMRTTPAEVAELVRAVKEIQPALQELFEARSVEERAAVLRRHPQLHEDPGSELLLAHLAQNQVNEGARAEIEAMLAFLFDCRTLGVEHALQIAAGFADLLPKDLKEVKAKLMEAVQRRDARELVDVVKRLASVARTAESGASTDHPMGPERGLAKIVGWLKPRASSENSGRRAITLALLGQALLHLFLIDRDRNHLDASISRLQEAVGSAEIPEWLRVEVGVALAHAHTERFEMSSQRGDLDAAVATLASMLERVPRGSERHGTIANNHAGALLRRYEFNGELNDLGDAIAAFEAAEASARADSREQALRRMNLGYALTRRFDTEGRAEDVKAAVRNIRAALGTIAESSPEYATAHTFLGIALVRQFRMFGSTDDIDEAIECHCRALSRATLDAERALCHGNLAFAYFIKFNGSSSATLEDLDAAIAESEKALLLGGDDPRRRQWLTNLGRGCLQRHIKSERPDDLDRAIEALGEAAAGCPQDSYAWATSQANLAQAYQRRGASSGGSNDFGAAVRSYAAALSVLTPESYPVESFEMARALGLLLGDAGSWSAATEAMELALRCVDRLYDGQLTPSAGAGWLQKAKELHGQAAYTMAKAGQVAQAAQALEAGRARELGRTLEIEQADLGRLIEAGHVRLVEQYRKATDDLRRLTNMEANAVGDLGPAFETAVRRGRRGLVEAVSAIREMPGHNDFLRPPTFEQLAGVASRCPLIFVAATRWGGLAIILGPSASGSRLVWLPDLTSGETRRRVAAWHQAYQTWRSRPAAAEARGGWSAAVERVTHWLWDVALGPILASAADGWPRAALVPFGPLGFLPLHAAWTEDPGAPSGRRYALDVMELRYAPSARSLGVVFDLAAGARIASALVIQDPQPVDAPPLPGAAAEAGSVAAWFEHATLISGADATKPRVLDALPNHSVHHFCCHGFVLPDRLLDSGLVMAGGEVITLREILGLRLYRARLAVLSACESGVVGDALPDEAVSFAAGFLRAGAAGVVSTLWAVQDLASALLVVRFYELWIEHRQEPAAATRAAQRWLRDTTNAQKAAWCEGWLPEFSGRSHRQAGTADRLYKRLRLMPPESRDFAGPEVWAAFSYAGA
jgi:tetratricopeptide (TPR) repeat protein